jgi:hypothetical protein
MFDPASLFWTGLAVIALSLAFVDYAVRYKKWKEAEALLKE